MPSATDYEFSERPALAYTRLALHWRDAVSAFSSKSLEGPYYMRVVYQVADQCHTVPFVFTRTVGQYREKETRVFAELMPIVEMFTSTKIRSNDVGLRVPEGLSPERKFVETVDAYNVKWDTQVVFYNSTAYGAVTDPSAARRIVVYDFALRHAIWCIDYLIDKVQTGSETRSRDAERSVECLRGLEASLAEKRRKLYEKHSCLLAEVKAARLESGLVIKPELKGDH